MASAFNQLKAFCRSNAGSTAVEFAIAAPILFVLMFAIIEFGRAWWTKNSLQYAIERAARYAIVCNGACPSDAAVTTFAASQVYDQMIAATAFTVTHPGGASGQTCVNYNFTYLPWFAGELAVMSGSTTFTGTSCRTPYPAS
jgi:Flp pilus assembly protein TadG